MKRYALVLVALLALTGLTFGLSFLHLGTWGTAVAMGIATTKAALIVLIFMHLSEHGVADRVAVGVALLLAGSLIAFALLDVRTRTGP